MVGACAWLGSIKLFGGVAGDHGCVGFFFSCVTVFYDTFQVVRFATKLLRLPLSEKTFGGTFARTRERESGGIILFGG